MHRPRRRGTRPPLLALLAALLLAARGAAAQGKRRPPVAARPHPLTRGHPSVGQPGAGHAGSAALAPGRVRPPATGLAGAARPGFAPDPRGGPFLGLVPRRAAAVVSADRKRGGGLGVLGVIGALLCRASPLVSPNP